MHTGGLKSNLKLAVGLQYDCTVNLDVEDGLTNGATCILKKIEYKIDSPKPSIVWVEFTDLKIGTTCRHKYANYYNKTIKKTWTPIFAVSRTFTVYKSLVSRQQFPLCPAAARTIHKCQGKTIQKAVIKMGEKKRAQSHYTALSRVTSIDNLYLLALYKEKIAVHKAVKDEMYELRKNRKVKLCYTPVYNMSLTKHRIIFHDIRSLHKHIPDVRANQNYRVADIIAFAESRLTTTDADNEYAICSFQLYRNDQRPTGNSRPPHGLATYIKDQYTIKSILHKTSSDIEYSIIKFELECRLPVQLAVVYKSNSCHSEVLLDAIRDIYSSVDNTDPFVVVGDFNIDISENQNKTLLVKIEEILKCKHHVTQATTIGNTTIDLLFTNCDVAVHLIDSVVSDHRILAIEC